MVDKNMYEKYDNKVEDIIQAQNGNQDAMEKLIEDNQGLMWSIIKRFQGRGFELEDLYQIATLGFIKCIKKFDTNFDVRLSTYAVPYILGEVKRHVQENGPIKVSRSIYEMSYKIDTLQKEHLRKTGKDMGLEEIAKELRHFKRRCSISIG